MSFGDRVRTLRRAQKLTLRELADRLKQVKVDIDFTYLSKIENNRTNSPPSEEVIRGLARVLRANAEELLDLAGRFDERKLQDVVSDIPEAGVLLRQLQERRISRSQVQEFLTTVLEEED